MSVDSGIPLRVCEPWCNDGDGHPDLHPDDRTCWTDIPQIELAGMSPIQVCSRGGGTEWAYDRVDVFAWRRPEANHPEILINHESGSELRFTLEEARQLRDRVTALIDLIA